MTTTTTSNLQARLASLMTTRDVADMFGVTSMTVHLWRMNRGLPVIVIPGDTRPAIRYDRADVVSWAAAQERRPRLQPRAARAA